MSAKISTGGSHTTAVTEEGDVYAWGNNGSGQLGNGERLTFSTPILMRDMSGDTKGDIWNDAHTIAVDTPIESVLNVPGDCGWYSFVPEETDTYSIYTDSYQNVTTVEYDKLNRPVEYAFPNGGTRVMEKR